MTKKQGIIVAADQGAEHLLIPWWQHYQKNNDLDVAFIDLGMSAAYREFCQQRGSVITLAPRSTLSSSLTTRQQAWFRKPQACLASPFDQTLWIDLDCQVNGDLSFLLSSTDDNIALCIDWIATLERSIQKKSTPSLSPQHLVFNSGLIIFSKGCPIILDWAQECINFAANYAGDQEALSFVIHQKKAAVTLLPPEANWLMGLGKQQSTLITHWHGQKGKEHFIKLSSQENLLTKA